MKQLIELLISSILFLIFSINVGILFYYIVYSVLWYVTTSKELIKVLSLIISGFIFLNLFFELIKLEINYQLKK